MARCQSRSSSLNIKDLRISEDVADKIYQKHGVSVDEVGVTIMAKLPNFKTDEEAAEFFDTHSVADFWDDMEPVEATVSLPRPPKSLVTVPMSQKLLAEIKEIANQRGIPYQLLVRQWLVERVNRERSAAS